MNSYKKYTKIDTSIIKVLGSKMEISNGNNKIGDSNKGGDNNKGGRGW